MNSISDLEKIMVIISLQKFFIGKQCWDFSANLRDIGRVINYDLYNQHFQKSQELDWSTDRFYHIDNFDLKDYNYAVYLIGNFCKNDTESLQKYRNLLDSNRGMMRNIKIDQILGD